MTKKISEEEKAALVKLGRVRDEFTVEPFNRGGFFIGGIDGEHVITTREDAEVIVAALNVARQYRKLVRRAELLVAEAGAFTDALAA